LSTTEDARSAVDDWFAAQPSVFYLERIKNCSSGVRSVLNSGGSMLNTLSVTIL